MSKYSSGYKNDEKLRRLLVTEMRYDPDTGDLWWIKSGPRRKLDKPVGTMHSSGYLIFSTGVGGKIYSLRAHRVAWLLYYGSWPEGFLDHINKKPSDNRVINLRSASYPENNRNKSMSSTNKSGYRGVSWSSYHNKWVARIGTGERHKFIGCFNCPTVAALAYDKASRKYHKSFGVRNFEGFG
jgi:hypothetical protein